MLESVKARLTTTEPVTADVTVREQSRYRLALGQYKFTTSSEVPQLLRGHAKKGMGSTTIETATAADQRSDVVKGVE